MLTASCLCMAFVVGAHRWPKKACKMVQTEEVPEVSWQLNCCRTWELGLEQDVVGAWKSKQG